MLVVLALMIHFLAALYTKSDREIIVFGEVLFAFLNSAYPAASQENPLKCGYYPVDCDVNLLLVKKKTNSFCYKKF